MPTESSIISSIRRRVRYGNRVAVGIGDDAAVVRCGKDVDLLLCSDLMIESIHFKTQWSRPGWIGHKALASAISDVAAMGGVPRFALVSIALPALTSPEFVDELLEGALEAAKKFGVDLVGGDTSGSPGPIFIDVSVAGECEKQAAVTRSGARPGDLIFVTGDLGSAALGLTLLEQGHRLGGDAVRHGDSGEAKAEHDAMRKHLLPEPRCELGQEIALNKVATSMIDISDGLSTDLNHLLEESGCGAAILFERVPVAQPVMTLSELRQDIDGFALSLHGGEEYELLFTADAEAREVVRGLSERFKLPITEIGEIVAEPGLTVEHSGRQVRLRAGGFEHLAGPEG